MRGKLDANDLIKIILVLVAIWIVIEILAEVLDMAFALLGLFPFSNLIGLIILLIIILWLLDYI